MLRRTNTLPPRLRGPTAERYRFGEWTFNAAQREIVGPEGLALPLSSGEFKLLMAFLERPKVALSREQLLSRVWGLDFDPNSNVVDVYVRYLRAKVGAAHIVTVRGAGYRWE